MEVMTANVSTCIFSPIVSVQINFLAVPLSNAMTTHYIAETWVFHSLGTVKKNFF